MFFNTEHFCSSLVLGRACQAFSSQPKRCSNTFCEKVTEPNEQNSAEHEVSTPSTSVPAPSSCFRRFLGSSLDSCPSLKLHSSGLSRLYLLGVLFSTGLSLYPHPPNVTSCFSELFSLQSAPSSCFRRLLLQEQSLSRNSFSLCASGVPTDLSTSCPYRH